MLRGLCELIAVGELANLIAIAIKSCEKAGYSTCLFSMLLRFRPLVPAFLPLVKLSQLLFALR